MLPRNNTRKTLNEESDSDDTVVVVVVFTEKARSKDEH